MKYLKVSICCLNIIILYETLKLSLQFISVAVALSSVKSWFVDNLAGKKLF